MTPQSVAIIGGSLNGATLALALTKCGVPVTVIDATPPSVQSQPGFDGRSYALSLASVRMLTALGLWDALQPDAQPILDIKVTDGRAGEGPAFGRLHFDHAELEEGPMGHMIEDRNLRRVLQSALSETDGITLITGHSVTEQTVSDARATLMLDTGQSLAATLIVGADGKRGPTAHRGGIRRTVTDYNQLALVCAIEHDAPHHGVAHQFFMPSGPLAILPLKGNRSSIVWTDEVAQARAVNALDDANYLSVLRPRFGDFLGEIRLAGARYTYPLSLSLASDFTSDRLALVGDAARAVHPLAGQGLNAGLRDVAALAQVVVEARRRGEDIGRSDVLERYGRWRRFDTTTLAAATDTFNRLFSNDNPILRLGRDIGLGLVNAQPDVRRSFMREAAGLTGTLPNLLRGDPI